MDTTKIDIVNQIYNKYLHRDVDLDGIKAYYKHTNSSNNIEYIKKCLVESEEYKQRNQNSPRRIVIDYINNVESSCSRENNSIINIDENTGQICEKEDVKIDYIESKEDFRRICMNNLPLLRKIIIPEIPKKGDKETFYIEFREFPHSEYLIRNMVIKLPNWAHTIVCGNKNFDAMKKLGESISHNINIVKLDIDNLDIVEYSQLLMTKEFWKNFHGEKLLLYQEDSFLFHNKIEQFLEYDWVGAPWPLNQDEHIDQQTYGVGNGGFSLRTKSKMIECIEKVNWKKDLLLQPMLKKYMKNVHANLIPEDVFFSKSLLENNMGKVAPRNVALEFSQETQKSENPLGGHNFYLADSRKNRKYLPLDIGLIAIRKRVGILSTLPYTLGGGEKYIADIMKFFLKYGYEVYLYNDTDKNTIHNTLKIYSIESETVQIYTTDRLRTTEFENCSIPYFDYFFEMSNNIIPRLSFEMHDNRSRILKLAYKHIYHCQFPENINNISNIDINDISNSEKYLYKIIVNSEYTDKYVEPYYNDKVKVLYPLCNMNLHEQKYTNKTSSCLKFVTIGRLFPYTDRANNKNIDIILNTFNYLSKMSDLDFQFHVICSIKDINYYHILIKHFSDLIKSNKIVFHPDCDDYEKENILIQSDFYIHATGIRNISKLKPSEEEHFGISVIEGMKSRCVPIIANRGFPPTIIKHNENGYIFDNEHELALIVREICKNEETFIKKLDLEQIKEQNYNMVDEYCNISKYESNFIKILMNA